MKAVTVIKDDLTAEDRNLLSVAYKNVVGSRRSSWRVISSMEMKQQQQEDPMKKLDLTREYREKIEEELRKICKEVIVSKLVY